MDPEFLGKKKKKKTWCWHFALLIVVWVPISVKYFLSKQKWRTTSGLVKVIPVNVYIENRYGLFNILFF